MKPVKVVQYGIVVAIMALAISRLIPHFKDFSKVWQLKDTLNYWWIFAAIFAQTFQYIGDGWFSQLFLRIADMKVRIKDSLRIASLNVFAAHILPVGEAGGLAAAYHFYKKLGVDTEKFIFLSICWTALIHILLILMFIISGFFVDNLSGTLNTSIISFGALILVLVIIGLYITLKKFFPHIEKHLSKYKWVKPFLSFIKNKNVYKKRLIQHRGLVFFGFLAGLVYYASNIASLVFSFLTFGIMPPMSVIIFAYASSLIFSKITLAPAGIGAAEASLILIFMEAKIDPTIAVGATLIYRLISFWFPIPAGFFSFYSLKKETKSSGELPTTLEEELFEDSKTLEKK